MCGRFSLRVEMEELLSYYGLIQSNYTYTPRYNIAPGQSITALIDSNSGCKMGPLRWGLVPSWATDERMGYKMINARAETLAEKPAFRQSYSRRRCIIPADGYYDWKKDTKQPHRITMNDESIFSLAALYDNWVAPDGNKLHSCTIITTESNDILSTIHDRMPVILPKEHHDTWLDRSITDITVLQQLLIPFPSKPMTAYQVSPMVGNVKNDVPACIEPFIEQ
ncbi:MAG: SOS response-associated peptidase [Paenibacillaceae bacterium]